jgi:hypothetical protein
LPCADHHQNENQGQDDRAGKCLQHFSGHVQRGGGAQILTDAGAACQGGGWHGGGGLFLIVQFGKNR